MSQETLNQIIDQVTRKEGFLKASTYNLVITNERLIFSKYTKAMQKEDDKALMESLKGKGFKDRFMETMSGNKRLYERYQDRSFEEILNETEGNFDIPFKQIKKVKRSMGGKSDDNNQEIPRKVTIIAENGSHELKFNSAQASDGTYNVLKSILKQ